MTQEEFLKFIEKLSKDIEIIAPRDDENVIKIGKIDDIKDIDFSGQMPINTWKSYVLPHRERLFDISKNKLNEKIDEASVIACIGINILDLKAMTLFEQVFSRDKYFQIKRNNLYLIGYSEHWPSDYKKFKVFSHNFEEDILEHISFDVFFAKRGLKMKIYSGSSRGQQLLKLYGVLDYEHIQFAGPVSEKGPDKRMLKIKEKIDQSFNRKMWRELGEICIACGKCSIACPTCFCFDLEDKNNPDDSGRDRRWGNCFYNNFSKVAGGHKDLDTVKKKIYFWYTHKFLRIPHEYNMPGCVSCGRCSRVCPVGIKIEENIKKILK